MLNMARLAREFDMSVVIFGVFIAQIVGLALLGLVLRFLPLLVARSTGVFRRSARGFWWERNPLAMRWLDVTARLLSAFGTPTASRAPPAGTPGSLQVIPATTAYRRRRRERSNELS